MRKIRKATFFWMVTDGRVKRCILVARRPRGTHKRGLRPPAKMKGSDVPLTDIILPHQKFDMGDFYKKRRFFEKFFLQAINQRKKRLSDSRFSSFAVDNLQIFLYFTQTSPFCQQLFRLWVKEIQQNFNATNSQTTSFLTSSKMIEERER